MESGFKRVEMSWWRVEVHLQRMPVGQMYYFETRGQAELAATWAAESRRQEVEARSDVKTLTLARRDNVDGFQIGICWGIEEAPERLLWTTDYFYVTLETVGRTVITEAFEPG